MVKEEPGITMVVNRGQRSPYMRRQKKHGRGVVLDICTRKLYIDEICGIGQVVSFWRRGK